jgi:hypothetical protein
VFGFVDDREADIQSDEEVSAKMLSEGDDFAQISDLESVRLNDQVP